MLEKFEPKSIFKFFEEISNIPRGSGNEKAVSDYLVAFAKTRNLFFHQDEALNVFIKKAGTKGYENSDPVIIQGHMDMVCEKNEDTVHNFEKDPIKLVIEGDILKAKGTTLGADNGVAVAYALALLDSNDISHPPLEVLITTDEEVGLVGAAKVDDSLFKGKLLLNLDSSEEGNFRVSCAGGGRADLFFNIEYDDLPPNCNVKTLKIRGLKGGHSGSDIGKERGNSNRLLGRSLKILETKFGTQFVDIKGGAKDNAIPRESEATIIFDNVKAKEVAEEVSLLDKTFKAEYFSSDEGVHIYLEDCKKEVKRVFTKTLCSNIISSILLIPNGIQAMSLVFTGLPETSLNIGVIETSEKEVIVSTSLRSSVSSRQEMLMDQIKTVAQVLNARLSFRGLYPGWEFKKDSALRTKAVKVFFEMFGREPVICGTHGGLECGILSEKIGGDIDIISFGPNIYDLHTPSERMEIPSFQRMWEFLKKLLIELA